MSQQLINHSSDLKRLRDDGYNIEVNCGYLVIRQIPYLNSSKEVKFGIMICKLTLANNKTTVKPESHLMYFIGEHPHNADGTIISGVIHSSQVQNLTNDLTINHTFSNSPKGGYENYYEQVKRYTEIITNQAKAIDDSVSATPFNIVIDEDVESVFQYMDTNSSRANINMLNAKFKNQKIAIIGLGGTGAYILDLVAKTQVKEIHLFDGDDFLLHNAFRSPGAASLELLETKPSKVNYYHEQYSKIHKNIKKYEYFINDENLSSLNEMSYVFISIDRNDSRKRIIEYLQRFDVPFIDVGLGVNVVVDGEDETLVGTLRTTLGTSAKFDHISKRVPLGDNVNNDYGTNIQVAELNNLNAVMAVIKWKKLSGFYQDLENEHHQTYSINVSQLLNEDLGA